MVKILDSTLREGEQTPGVYFDMHIKSAIADLLDKSGVGIIEAGHPVVTREVKKAVSRIAGSKHRSLTGAHARSLTSDIDAAISCNVDFLGIFYCVSDERLDLHSKNVSEISDIISNVIWYARSKKESLKIRYTPEDTVRSSWNNVITVSAEAVRSGADIISIADTTGYMIPGTERSMYDYVMRFREAMDNLGLAPEIAVHCHNDRGLALANTVDGIRAGATIADASVLGLGERAGITDLASLAALLYTDFDCKENMDLTVLGELYDLVSRYSKINIPCNAPFMGENAFTHCAGVHSQAAIADPLHYQSIAPDFLNRETKLSLDHMSGVSAVAKSLEDIDTDFDEAFLRKVNSTVKEIGQTGRCVDLTELRYIVSYLRGCNEGEEL